MKESNKQQADHNSTPMDLLSEAQNLQILGGKNDAFNEAMDTNLPQTKNGIRLYLQNCLKFGNCLKICY